MIDEGTLYDSRTGTPARDRIFWSSLILIVVFGAWLRLYRLADYPQYFNQDESVLGYDAWSLWQTGHDQHGDVLPVFFRTFGDYVPPAANYLTAPVVGLLGLNEFATRLPAAVSGFAHIFFLAITGARR